MDCHCIIGNKSTFFTQMQIAFTDFNENLDIPSFSIDTDDFIFAQFSIG